MIRRFGSHEVYLAVASSGRPGSVPHVVEKIGDATWHVPEDQWDAYAAAGLAPERLAPGRSDGVAHAYNVPLRAAHELGATCLRFDDDLYGQILRADLEGGAAPITAAAAFEVLLDRLEEYGLALAGVGQSGNPYYVRKAVSTKNHVSTWANAVKPVGVYHDDRFRVFVDVDYTLEHISRFGGALRCDDIIMRFRMHAPGGVQDYRLMSPDGKYADPACEVTLADSRLLAEKWGPLVGFRGGNPVRPYVKVSRRRRL